MCSIDDADYSCTVLSTRTPVAKKTHKCYECLRKIRPGERYLYEALTDEENDGIRAHKTCSHCQVARQWLHRECGGWLYGGIEEDISDHTGYGMGVTRMIVGMRKKWTRRDGLLMKIPTLPGTSP